MCYRGGWTAKLEYLYLDLGKQTGSATTIFGTSTTWSERTTDNIVRVGLNYRWGGGAYEARSFLLRGPLASASGPLLLRG